MKPLRIAGATRRLAEDQDEYIALSIRDWKYDGQPVMSSAWEPMPDELDMVAKGAHFFVTSVTSRGYEPALSREILPDERDQLLKGGSVVLTIPGRVHPPICPQIIPADKIDMYAEPTHTVVAVGVRKAPDL